MPPEQEPQLEALRRYMETLGTNGADAPPRPARSRRQVVLAAVVAAALLLAGILIGRAMQPDRPEPAAARLAAGAAASPQCVTAVARANKSLGIASKVEEALAEHTEYMNQLLHGQISGQVALQKGMPSLIDGAAQSGRFDAALADYKDVVARCHLQGQPRP
jgi:hypothetical protein